MKKKKLTFIGMYTKTLQYNYDIIVCVCLRLVWNMTLIDEGLWSKEFALIQTSKCTQQN
jgi:hypothetical protein